MDGILERACGERINLICWGILIWLELLSKVGGIAQYPPETKN